MTAELSVELAEATLYADDGAAEVVKEFQSGTLTLGIDDIGVQVAQDLTGAKIDDNKVLISASEDGGEPVAIGFRAKKSNGKYRYFWLYKVKFGIPATNLTTKGESIEFSTPTIEGTVLRRNKLEVRAGIRGRRRFPRIPPESRHRLSAAGTPRCMSRHSRRCKEAFMDDRSAKIEIGGREFELILTTRATKEIAGRYGGLENLGEKLMRSENFEMALDELVWLITLLANQSVLIHNLRTPEDKQELLTQETVELLTSPLELAEYKSAIMEAMFKGTKRNVESENNSKNAQVG